MQVMFYNWDVPLEEVKEFVGPTKLIMPFDGQNMIMINSRFGLQTLHTNTYLVKTSDDIFIMSVDSYEELLIAEIENI